MASKKGWLTTCIGAVLLLSLGATASYAQSTEWPRIKSHDGIEVILHQPQIDNWVDFTRLEGRLVVELTPEASSEAIVGALRIHAATRTDLASRRVLISDIQIAEVRFPSLNAEQEQTWERWLSSLLRRSSENYSLDELLAYLEYTEATAQSPVVNLGEESSGENSARSAPSADGLATEPPEIFFSKSPAILVVVDGVPVRYPIDGTDLSYVVNTNWTLLFEEATERYFLLNGDSWLTALTLQGSWEAASQLPPGLNRLPVGEEWAEVRRQVPGSRTSDSKAPVVFAVTEPAELIVVAGELDLQAIPGTGLFYVKNTESDLFVAESDGHYYYLVSGRWFIAEDLRGPWRFATPELPPGFQRIPADHPRGRVLASVPGTRQAEEAVLLARMPTKATVKRSEATAEVVYQGPPEFTSIEETTIAYAVNTPFDVLKIGPLYYLCFQGVWFVSSNAQGPWAVADKVPGVVYTIPVSSPVHHLTYVYVYDSTPEVVVVGYAPGYLGLYVSRGCVVYGTGYYYAPYVYWGPYPVYYPYHYSYGAAAYYDPATGTYARRAVAYGPYGGAGRAAVYNPTTGAYARGASAWGPYGGTAAYETYNPRTQSHRVGYQSADAYSQWGETVVQRADDWAHIGHYTDSRGTVAGYENSRGGKGLGVQTTEGRASLARGADDSLYAGKDGNVYKWNGSGWSRYEDGSWNQVAGSKTVSERSAVHQLNREAQARQQGAQRSRKNFAGRSGGFARTHGGF